MTAAVLLVVEGLTVTTAAGASVLDDVAITVGAGQSLGLVGESGSGKTALAHAILGYARPGLRISAGTVRIAGEDMVGPSEREMRAKRGRLVSYVPQDPGTALNPSRRIGDQIREICRAHASERDPDVLTGAVLERVELPSGRAFQRRFPHQLSGGQQQRVALAIALVCDPPLVVLDEPTTGLDVVTQARILEEVRRLQRDLNVALVYASRDLAAVAAVTDDVAVMYAGVIVERAPTAVLAVRPRHPYSRGLVASVPDHVHPRRLRGIPGVAAGVGERPPGCPFAPRCELRIADCEQAFPAEASAGDRHLVRCLRWEQTPAPDVERRSVAAVEGRDALLTIDRLVAQHRTHGALLTVVDQLSLSVAAGECVAVVGESGSGKTTMARCVVGLHRPASGRIAFDGEELAGTAGARTKEQRRRIQIVFQNPYESLNPRHSVASAIAWPARALRGSSRAQAQAEVEELLERVRLPARIARRYPAELSGGERQRVAVARALAAHPDLLVCDEITSALDVSVQAAALDLLSELRRDLGLAMLFITHDLGVVASVADAVVVLEQGIVRERGGVQQILEAPSEPYTRRLIEAAPSLTGVGTPEDDHHAQAAPTA